MKNFRKDRRKDRVFFCEMQKNLTFLIIFALQVNANLMNNIHKNLLNDLSLDK